MSELLTRLEKSLTEELIQAYKELIKLSDELSVQLVYDNRIKALEYALK